MPLKEGLGLWCVMPLPTIFQLYRGRIQTHNINGDRHRLLR